MLSRIKGTQDLLELSTYNFLIDQARQHLALYSFDEIATPILEPLELFQRSLGLHTDVVTKQMYMVHTTEDFDINNQKKTKIVLRPEGTASTMRAFFNNNIEKRPWKVFSHGPMFRHERPQKGRYRQFHQMTIEMIGAHSIAHDAELLATLEHFFGTRLGMESYALLINFLGSPEDRDNYKKALTNFLDHQKNLPPKIIELKEKNILRIFDLKDPACKTALENAPVITDHLSDESRAEWEYLTTLLDNLSISYSHDPRLVRGLDYYNKTVFEFVSGQLGAQNAFCAGGRYDYLSQTLGEKEAVPSLGAALGIERIVLMLEQQREKQAFVQKPTLNVVLPLAQEQQTLGLLCAETLRTHGLCCDIILDTTSIKSMMRKANKMGAHCVLIIGHDEQANNYITVKNMTTGDEQQVKQGDIVEHLKK